MLAGLAGPQSGILQCHETVVATDIASMKIATDDMDK